MIVTADEAILTQTPANRFSAVRARTEALAAPLSPEDMMVQSMPDVSPTKWHLGHTSWFFETFILKNFSPAYKVFDEAYNYLFNSYYNAVGDRQPRPKRGMLTRPPLSDVMAYRAQVTEAMLDLIGLAEKHKDWPGILKLLELGCHHEQQHQELLLTDIKHVLFQNPFKPAYSQAAPDKAKKTEKLSWRGFAEGLVEIGHLGDGFSFDCEGPRHKVYLNAFELASRPVSNGEYLEFIEDGGYARPDHWLSDGWAHICQKELSRPLYWERRDQEWREFTLRGEQPLNPGAPVCHLSYYEADAYARWKEVRLPTEAELEIAANGPGGPGEVWQWTSSAYSPYPGFKAAKGAVGEYNGKFMCSQMVLRGGSGATAEGHWRPTYRNFFYPPDAWQFTGLRLARDK
ncbi:MAG: ergothioneine biosynthesis protein EgtB [Proteobacteria bacterium]|nr:ergothioneine biosynthesis protein EgtB [Pseudomonadota bacterium]